MQSLSYMLWIEKELFNDFLIGKWKWIYICNKAYLIHDYDIVDLVDAFITSNK